MSSEFPKEFKARVENDPFLGAELLVALNSDKPTAVRAHSLKHNNQFKDSKAIPWSKNGFWLNERPLFTLDPHFHAGSYYPQEAGSQFLDAVLRSLEFPDSPNFLDLCAAPGGKSTLIADFLNEKGILLSNEINSNRAKILKENLTKWGNSNTFVSNNSPEDFLNILDFFDCIVVDAPCSGEGMFRKDLNARNEWSEQNVEMCANRQKDILSKVWGSLKQDGYLIYSTCTFNSNENEEIIDWLTEKYACKEIKIDLPLAKVGRNGIGHYGLPHLINTEGFFICVIQKTEQTKSRKIKIGKSDLSLFKDSKETNAFCTDSCLEFIQWRDFVFGIPADYFHEIQFLQQQLRIQKLGLEIGELTRKGIIPNEALAFAHAFQSNSIQQISLSKQQALHYLKGETFPLDGQHGWALVKYENNCLGWIKHLGNRFNNLFPKEWRIRMKIE